MRNRLTKSNQAPLTEGGRLQKLIEAGDSQELARRTFTLQSVALDLHRQFAHVDSQEELARVLSLALMGSYACERLAILRCDEKRQGFRLVAHAGDVEPARMNDLRGCCRNLAPLLPHQPLLAPLLPPFSTSTHDVAHALGDRGFERVAWLDVEGDVQFIVLLGTKMTALPWDEFDGAILRATFDAAHLACSKLLLVDELEQRNDQLREANERLLGIDDLKSAILSGVSHELRTPLTRILSYAETLHESTAQDAQTREFLGVILNNTKQLSGLVDEALHFAELIGARTKPKRERVSLHDAIEDIVVRSRPDANHRMIRIESQCAPHYALTDTSYVRVILRTLMSNALKFTPGGGLIQVDLIAEDQGASILLKDTGPGIPEETRERIWRLFEQGDMTLRREVEGLGLGLALAQRLAQELEVKLELLESSEAGSTFRVHFQHALPSLNNQSSAPSTTHQAQPLDAGFDTSTPAAVDPTPRW
jgi:signal transduction histidine kinase